MFHIQEAIVVEGRYDKNAVRQVVESTRGAEEELAPLAFSILRKEDIYAPENQKLLFPVMSSSGR